MRPTPFLHTQEGKHGKAGDPAHHEDHEVHLADITDVRDVGGNAAEFAVTLTPEAGGKPEHVTVKIAMDLLGDPIRVATEIEGAIKRKEAAALLEWYKGKRMRF